MTIIPQTNRRDEQGCTYDYVVREASDADDVEGHTTVALFTDLADATLFASAPDLLAALIEVTPEVYGCNRARHTFTTQPDCADCQRCERARAAIAKAKP